MTQWRLIALGVLFNLAGALAALKATNFEHELSAVALFGVGAIYICSASVVARKK